MVSRSATLFILFFAVSTASSQIPIDPSSYANGAMGKEFWIAIPPNEINPFPVDNLEVYITSAYDTEVEVFDAESNKTYKRKLLAGQIRTLSDKRGETNWSWEIRETERVTRKGIRLKSAFPITVSVMSSKVTTSDGYLALPVSAWDTSYIVTSYFDFREVKSWAGGFVIVAAENGTIVDITLRGVGGNDAKTSGGKSINTGRAFQVSMDEGDVYYVQGDGTTRGLFDMTGTLITSNNPVGLISCHQRTTMPNLLVNGNGRNHLVEMNIPVSQWDTTFATIEFKRQHLNGQGLGDMFRVVAAEANTTWTMKSYDMNSHSLISQQGGVIANAGGFADITQSASPTHLPSGLTIWKADKPVQVVQYSCSSTWDGDPILDPFQINLLPTDRFVNSTCFQLPTANKFYKHHLNLVFKGDESDDSIIEKLKAVTIDGAPLWNDTRSDSGQLIVNHIEGTPYWYMRIALESTDLSYTVVSPRLRFGGYLYGFGEFDAYGWPLGPLHANIVAMDTSQPGIDITKVDDTFWDVNVSEVINIPSVVRARPLKTDQVDAGIAEVGLMLNSHNVELTTIFPPGEKRVDATTGLYRLRVLNVADTAYATVYAVDYMGNISQKAFALSGAPPVLSTVSAVDFGTIDTDSTVCPDPTIVITNTGGSELRITSLSIKEQNTPFWFNGNLCDALPMTIAPTESKHIKCICAHSATPNQYEATLQIASNDATTLHEVRMHLNVEKAVSVDDDETADDIEVTLSGDALHVQWPSSTQPTMVTLSSISGQVMVSYTAMPSAITAALSVAHCPPGVYILQVQTGVTSSSRVITHFAND